MKPTSRTIAVIGAGPAGLMAAEVLARAGKSVTIYDRMPSPGRKFLLAGRGGLNLTHSEPMEAFLARYGDAAEALAPAIRAYPPDALKAFSAELGEETFTGTSGRLFPKSFKATPLLRAWLRRLDSLGVSFRFRMQWSGWDAAGDISFESPEGPVSIKADALLLALGGASWPRLGSDGGWARLLATRGVEVTPLQASNIGVLIEWSPHFRSRFAGEPIKACEFRADGATSRAEAVVTQDGLEGGAIYALSAPIRSALAAGPARISIDLKPDVSAEELTKKLASARAGETLANILRKRTGLAPVAIGLMREAAGKELPQTLDGLVRLIKDTQITIAGVAGMDRAISTAGGVAFTAIDAGYMLREAPGVFVAGEMLDWEAPTGGYLLQACFSTGVAAAQGALAWLERPGEN